MVPVLGDHADRGRVIIPVVTPLEPDNDTATPFWGTREVVATHWGSSDHLPFTLLYSARTWPRSRGGVDRSYMGHLG
jgi:hypothetical protein